MTTGALIEIDPPELRFPFELHKEISCSLLLSNKTHDHIAFKVMTTSWNCMMWPNREILLPQSTCRVEFTMLAQSEAPPDMQCGDLFVVQSVTTFPGATMDDIRSDMFTEESGNMVDEVLLRAVYVSPSLIDRSIDLKVSTGKLLEIEAPELAFPFELGKQAKCSILLSNKTDDHIAFRFKESNWEDCIVRPSTEILLPRSTCNVVFTIQLRTKAPPDMQCEEWFIVQSVVTFEGATRKDITHEMFTKEAGNTVDQIWLFIVYMPPPNPPSPFPGGCDEGSFCCGTSRKFGNGLQSRRLPQADRTINSNDNFAGRIEASPPKEYEVQMSTGERQRHWWRLSFRFSCEISIRGLGSKSKWCSCFRPLGAHSTFDTL